MDLTKCESTNLERVLHYIHQALESLNDVVNVTESNLGEWVKIQYLDAESHDNVIYGLTNLGQEIEAALTAKYAIHQADVIARLTES